MSGDTELFEIIARESERQRSTLCLIASENIVSPTILRALGSVFTNKTVEGRVGHRYHRGAAYADQLEVLAERRACSLFGATVANVQSHSCSQANASALLTLAKPGDLVLSMALKDGGHLSHGFPRNISGQLYKIVHYGICTDSYEIDYDSVLAIAKREKPCVIIAGTSSYPRHIYFEEFRRIADEVGAALLVDAAHFAGLIAGGQYPSPFPSADIVTMSTYKTLRGPRGGLILAHRGELGWEIASSVFPGVQGTPCLNTIAGKAVCLREAATSDFKDYTQRVVLNARSFAAILLAEGIEVVTKGTDSHIVMVDLRRLRLTGKQCAEVLEQAGIICNMNLLADDPLGALTCSGVRFGLAGATTQGLAVSDVEAVAIKIASLLKTLSSGGTAPTSMIEGTRKWIEDLLLQSSPHFPTLD